jgi:hypothetical protein
VLVDDGHDLDRSAVVAPNRDTSPSDRLLRTTSSGHPRNDYLPAVIIQNVHGDAADICEGPSTPVVRRPAVPR